MAATTHLTQQRPARHGRKASGVLVMPLLFSVGLIAVALGYIGYVLWPRWPGPAVTPQTPAIPITIAGAPFNVPPAAIRVAVQRRPGAHERIDLAFLWPSLEAPDANVKPAAELNEPPRAIKMLDRVFVTIVNSNGALPPAERVTTIYPRYTAAQAVTGPDGLAVLAFRDGTPYQGEDLIYDAAHATNFVTRCSRDGRGATPGTCLYERRIAAADIVVRFPRAWLTDWRNVAATIDRLITNLQPHT